MTLGACGSGPPRWQWTPTATRWSCTSTTATTGWTGRTSPAPTTGGSPWCSPVPPTGACATSRDGWWMPRSSRPAASTSTCLPTRRSPSATTATCWRCGPIADRATPTSSCAGQPTTAGLGARRCRSTGAPSETGCLRTCRPSASLREGASTSCTTTGHWTARAPWPTSCCRRRRTPARRSPGHSGSAPRPPTGGWARRARRTPRRPTSAAVSRWPPCQAAPSRRGPTPGTAVRTRTSRTSSRPPSRCPTTVRSPWPSGCWPASESCSGSPV